jgi:hypothetical protein
MVKPARSIRMIESSRGGVRHRLGGTRQGATTNRLVVTAGLSMNTTTDGFYPPDFAYPDCTDS